MGEKLPLGFTFSFPCKQEGLAKARLSKWTKGFRCEGVVGEDLCILLHEALKRKGVGLFVVSILVSNFYNNDVKIVSNFYNNDVKIVSNFYNNDVKIVSNFYNNDVKNSI